MIRTPVGSVNLPPPCAQHQAVIGGEGNGGVIWPKMGHVRDSLPPGMALGLAAIGQNKQTAESSCTPDFQVFDHQGQIRSATRNG